MPRTIKRASIPLSDRPFGGELSIWCERMMAEGRDVIDVRSPSKLAMDDADWQLRRDGAGNWLHGPEDRARPYLGHGDKLAKFANGDKVGSMEMKLLRRAATQEEWLEALKARTRKLGHPGKRIAPDGRPG